MESFPWGAVIVVGPILLIGALAYGYLKSAKQDREIDPHTPGDDPSKGMTGHD